MSVKGTKIAAKSAAKTTRSKTKAAPVVEAAKPKGKAKGLTECLCGCGEQTQSRFLPGHDARMKSRLVNTALGTDKAAAKAAEKQLAELNWSQFLVKSRDSR